MYLPKFFKSLWENPEIVALILMNSLPQEINKTLIRFFGNNFYENIISSKYIQNNLMYIITLLLKNEINNFENEENPMKFLDVNSTCGYLLYELRSKDDTQIFIKKVIEEVVGQIDEYPNKICFDTNKINEYITNRYNKIYYDLTDDLSEEEILNEIVKNRLGNETKNKFKLEKMNDFNKYLKDIEIEIDFKNNIDNEIINYYNTNFFQKNNSFTNLIDNFLKENINNFKYKKQTLIFHQNDFYIVKNFIESFLKNLIENLNIIPYSIKTICKIISILIKKKFPKISIIRHNGFIARFFFCALFWPILQDDNFGALIENYVINKNTLENLQIIINIFVKFIIGELFINNETTFFSPFNRLFIETMPELIKLCENLTNVNIPKYIIETLDDNNYKFDFSKENNEYGFIHRSICFSIHDLTDIIKNIFKGKNEILNEKYKDFQLFFDRLCYNENANMINKIKEKEREDKNNSKLYYFLMSDYLFINDKIKKLFDIKQISNHFTINEIKDPKTDEEINKNLIIKVKNFISGLLFNFIVLTKEDFSKECSMDIYDILKELLILSKIPNYIVDDTIPTQWYVSSLIEILPKLPREITNNNCQILIEEMINEINKEIKDLDFETLSFIHGKLNFTKRRKLSIQSTINTIRNIDLNEKMDSIINNDNIVVGLSFYYDGKNTIFNIVQEDSIFDYEIVDDIRSSINIKPKISNSISSFIQNFPDFTDYQRLQDIDILDFEENLNIQNQLSNYFKIINNHLKENNNISGKELNEIKEKIYDYIMLKLYDKLFPPEPSQEENRNYQNTVKYSWVEPKHFIKERIGSIYNSFLPDVIKYLKLIIKEKSPRKKIENVSKVFNAIKRVIEFNGGKGLLGVDDYTPILSYSIIKAQPYRIISSIKYAYLYNPNKESGIESQNLIQFLMVCDFVTNLSYEKLMNISKEEFNEKMNSQK